MRKIGLLALAGALFAAPVPASAGFFVEGSLGLPWRTSPDLHREPTNVLVTPGYQITWVSVELGLVADFAQFERPGAWGLRPMIGVRPPMLPVYGKLILDVHDLGRDALTSVGGALGASYGLGPVAVFLEGDFIPRKVNDQSLNVLELRLGVSFEL